MAANWSIWKQMWLILLFEEGGEANLPITDWCPPLDFPLGFNSFAFSWTFFCGHPRLCDIGCYPWTLYSPKSCLQSLDSLKRRISAHLNTWKSIDYSQVQWSFFKIYNFPRGFKWKHRFGTIAAHGPWRHKQLWSRKLILVCFDSKVVFNCVSQLSKYLTFPREGPLDPSLVGGWLRSWPKPDQTMTLLMTHSYSPHLILPPNASLASAGLLDALLPRNSSVSARWNVSKLRDIGACVKLWSRCLRKRGEKGFLLHPRHSLFIGLYNLIGLI